MQRARPLLGTIVTIQVNGASDPVLLKGIEAAFAAVARAHRLMTIHDPASDVSRLNRATPGVLVQLDRWTAMVLDQALAIDRATSFLFDCACAAPLAAEGFLPAAAAGPDAAGSLADLRILPDGQAVVSRPLALDLGGIAKGFAVDRAIDALASAGVPSASVNAGGDWRFYGLEPRPVHVRCPRDPARVFEIGRFAAVAIATSAGYNSRRRVGVRNTTPLVDPRTGRTHDLRRSVSVLTEACMIADALTKPVALSGRQKAAWLDAFGAQAVILPWDDPIPRIIVRQLSA